MKIVYIYDAIARIGGAEKILVDKMNYLADNYNQEVYLITTSQGKHPFTFLLSKNVKHIDLSVRLHTIYQYSLLKRVYIGWKMNRLLKQKLKAVTNELNPDIIISTTYCYADITCNFKCKAKKIIESHVAKDFTGINDGIKRNFISNIYTKWKQHNICKTIEKKSDIIITLTHGDANSWNTKNVVVIPNIVDLKNTDYSQQTEKTAIFAGRFTYQKGLERMLEAWKIVVSKRNDWILKLVGEGEQKEYLRQQCQKLGITDNVIFAPATKNIEKEYINSSLFLFTSRYEGFALVLVEAMQCGIPCVSFDCPYGPSDIIDNGINGYLVKNGDVEEFAEATLKLIEDDELRKKMGKAAIEKSKQYLPKYIMPKWIEIFRQQTKLTKL